MVALFEDRLAAMSIVDLYFWSQTASQMLSSLASWLDKAQVHRLENGQDPRHMLAWQLAPDMYPLGGQIHFACFLAREPLFRLRSLELPVGLLLVREKGWSSHEHTGSITDAADLLTETIGQLQGRTAANADAGLDQPVVLELRDGSVFEMSGAQYMRDWALPQFYFHVNAAYAILRHYGIDLGKRDYVPHMFRFLRQ